MKQFVSQVYAFTAFYIYVTLDVCHSHLTLNKHASSWTCETWKSRPGKTNLLWQCTSFETMLDEKRSLHGSWTSRMRPLHFYLPKTMYELSNYRCNMIVFSSVSPGDRESGGSTGSGPFLCDHHYCQISAGDLRDRARQPGTRDWSPGHPGH